MKKSSILNGILILIILLAIVIPSIIKVKQRHNRALILNTENMIIDAAKNCYFTDICLNQKILLKELYEYNLIEPIPHPITKEYYNENSYVIINKNSYEFVEIKED